MFSTSSSKLAVIFCVSLLTACGGDSPSSPIGNGDTGGADGGSGSGGNGSTIIKIGNGTGSAFAEGALSATTTSLQPGASTDIVVNLVNADNTAISDDLDVTFSSDCVANALADLSDESITTSAGRASVVYTARGCSGTDTVTARADVGGTIIQATLDLTIAVDQALALNFVSAEREALALKGMGGNETSRVTFRLVGEQGAPIRNELITFVLGDTAGGISLAPNADGDPVRETVVSDNDGIASVVVRSGTVATNTSVTATHNSTGIQGVSQALVISTGVPIDHRFSISFGPQAPAGAYSTDGIEVDVSVIASDQFGNPVFDGTRVSFGAPESGSIDPFCTLQDGRCTVTWRSADPRPASGRATIIAYTSGAEYFEDDNSNGIFDEGEAWVNLSEAFADSNEDGVYGSDETGRMEFFVDVPAGNPTRGVVNSWDSAANLPDVWDGPCLSGNCPDEARDSVTIWRNRTIIISDPRAVLFSYAGAGASPQNCTTPIQRSQEYGAGSRVGILNIPGAAGANSATLSNFFVADGTPRGALPCHILGNPMPSGTTIEFATDNGKLSEPASWTVTDPAYYATRLPDVTISSDGTSSVGTLTLTVTPPQASAAPPSVFTWEVQD
ncbi:hypothetical protein F6455_07410 [Proteobacteria bacterium 005FR1]|nr:hypothetical protein [Proteobacteria bacterium 005FR1]